MNSWSFLNDNFIGLTQNLKLEDKNSFDFRDCFNFDIIHFMTICIHGAKKYLLNDKEENERFTHMKFKIMKIVHGILSAIPYTILFYYLFIKYDILRALRK